VRSRAGLAALAALAALLSACAAPTPKMSFADAGFRLGPDADEADAPPPVRNPVPEAVATEVSAGPPVDPVLLRFAAEARARRGRNQEGSGFPADAVAAWRALLGDLDGYLARPLPQTPLLELVRTRFTVEAEWDYDLRRYGAPPPELAAALAARSGRLAVRQESARALGLALVARSAPGRLQWPVEQAGISSPFGLRTDPIDGTRRLHRGLDLAAEKGRVVSAAAGGWVVRTGFAGGFGLMVEVRHPGDLTTRYSHLSAILCVPGDAVETGQPLGLVGQSGRSTGPHLHFEVWKDGLATDPLPWLRGGAGPVLARRSESKKGAPR
jgi:murein DD-endopeptidase MepM/ murein hydrolase activator NlpD